MEPARKLDYPQDWNRPSSGAPKPSKPEHILDEHRRKEQGQEGQPWDIKLGKMIFLPDRRDGHPVLLLAEWYSMPLLTV